MPYTRPYPGGFVDFPSTSTPIDASTLNTMDVGIKTANDQFQTVTTAQRATLTPSVGQAVWDSDLKQLMVFMNASGGNAWQPVGNRIVCASTTRPSSPFEGQEIYETDSQKTLVYNGASWVETSDLDNTGGLSDAGLAQTVRVFANEAARDAAITAPSEGMVAYLTAPTIPAATANTGVGGYTAVPSGVLTVYNGSVWVCTTEVGAGRRGSSGHTTTSTTYVTTLTGDSTAMSVTLVTGTTALVMFGVAAYPAANASARASIAVSGATTLAASDDYSVVNDNAATQLQAAVTSTQILTGLTAGTNTFTLSYRTNTGTCNYIQRWLVVKGIA